MGAALLTRSGRIIRGASIDNAAYGMWSAIASWSAMQTNDPAEATVCAERVAIVKAVVSGSGVDGDAEVS